MIGDDGLPEGVTTWQAILSGFVSCHFLHIGDMSRHEALELNTQVSTVGALVWFARSVELGDVFEFIDADREVAPGAEANSVPLQPRVLSTPYVSTLG